MSASDLNQDNNLSGQKDPQQDPNAVSGRQTGQTYDQRAGGGASGQTNQVQTQLTNQAVSKTAEEKETAGSMFKEGEPTVYEKKEFEVSTEVKDWVKQEKKEEIVLPQPVKDEFGQILMEAAQPAKLKIVLPLNKNQIGMALKYKIADSVRWMAEWCLRLIKMFPKRVKYGSSN
jgi:hypothetical protein